MILQAARKGAVMQSWLVFPLMKPGPGPAGQDSAEEAAEANDVGALRLTSVPCVTILPRSTCGRGVRPAPAQRQRGLLPRRPRS
jgi:hypothetical protein